MRDSFNSLWRHKVSVWFSTFTFCLVVNAFVHLVFGRPDWVFAFASSFGLASGLLVVANLKRDRIKDDLIESMASSGVHELSLPDYIGKPYALLRPLTAEEVETLHAEYLAGLSKELSPNEQYYEQNAYLRRQYEESWAEFWGEFEKGGEIYEFSTSKESWDALRGSGGYLIQRNGEEVARYVRSFN